MPINSYDDFCRELLTAGFTLGGANGEGVFSLFAHCGPAVRWHTGDPRHDPWQWRHRVLTEREDIAYGKLFFNKTGYITREWYPYFLAARRGGADFSEAYSAGTFSRMARRVYDALADEGMPLPVFYIKSVLGITKENRGAFEAALGELQARMYIALCGQARKVSRRGEEYGWNASAYCLAESFFGADVFDEAQEISQAGAVEAITRQVYALNPQAEARQIKKFIAARVY